MKAQLAGLSVGVLILVGCASSERGGLTNRDTLNEPSDRMAALEDRRPPNPNRPADNREQQAVPTIVQKDPVVDKAPIERTDKGLSVNAGPDQLVRPQDPTRSEQAPAATGAPAARQQETMTSADSALAARVKEAIVVAKKGGANVDPKLTAKESNGENKGTPNIEVSAKNGRVILSGSVESEAERTAMEQAASRVSGVLSVNNYLTVTKTNKP